MNDGGRGSQLPVGGQPVQTKGTKRAAPRTLKPQSAVLAEFWLRQLVGPKTSANGSASSVCWIFHVLKTVLVFHVCFFLSSSRDNRLLESMFPKGSLG